jgi:hypothetical protein
MGPRAGLDLAVKGKIPAPAGIRTSVLKPIGGPDYTGSFPNLESTDSHCSARFGEGTVELLTMYVVRGASF